MDDWRWADSRGQQRRVSVDEIRAGLADGVLAPNTPVWRRGWSDWKPANLVDELRHVPVSAASDNAPDVSPPPAFVVAAQKEFEGASGGAEPGPEEPPPPPHWVPEPIVAAQPIASAKPPGDRGPGKSLPPPLPKKKSAPTAPTGAGTHAPTVLGLAPAAPAATGTHAPAATGTHAPTVLGLAPAAPAATGTHAPTVLGLAPAAPAAPGTHAPTVLGLAPAAVPRAGDAEPALPPAVESPLVAPLGPTGGLPDGVRRVLARPTWQLVAGGVALAVVLLGMAGLVTRLLRGPASARPAPMVSASAPEIVPTAPSAVGSAVVPTPVPEPLACRVTGEVQLVAPKALVASGVEVVALAGAMGVGFASAPKEARMATLNVTDVVPTGTKKAKAPGTIRRVTPLVGGALVVDVDRDGDRLQGRRAVGAFDIGVADHALVLGAHGKDQTQKLWSLETDASVDALRGVSFGDGVAVAYRHAGAVWIGAAKGDRTAVSPPVRVSGLGPQLGAPAIAAASGTVLVAWADRAQASDAWGLRLLSWHPGEAAPPARAFALPADGLGEHAMSPGLTGLAKEKFLLVWTEGSASHHQVRAQVLASDGTPAGAPFAVSAAGVDAGQGQAAVLADGHGVVAFLAATGASFDVRAVPIVCE